ncbi:hypothetical protein LUZ63_011125 [Rhynchospora breviuscula]|uniref:Uncharacterized protein n=1 Tax=Rhynchospora breviuscula TaxID=2022672 RepID=A0A9Q0CI64_9POAL|nr:hypothetical protein LUZ63_011125 [Rhynchospora breviuscula]
MAWNRSSFLVLLLLPLGKSLGRMEKFFSLDLARETKSVPSWPVFTAGVFVAAALVLSLFLIIEHLSSYNQPEEQKFLIGLILMVPIYGVESFLSLLNSDAAFICEVMRDCYEAFAMYCFERYLIACLGGEEATIKVMEAQTQFDASTPLLEFDYQYGVVKHPFPLNCIMRSWYLGSDFYHAVKIGIVQYMILKPICAVLSILLQLVGLYGEGKFEWTSGYPYLAVILNFSQTWALYCLVQFYTVTKEKLEAIQPLAKFLTFKSIVFLTWWQGIIIAFLFSMGVLKGHLAQQLQARIQDYIICIEMGVAAVVHLKVFPARPYQQGERCVRNVAVMSDYAALGTPPDPEEVRDSGRLSRVHVVQPEDKERRLSFPQSVRDVVLGSSEIVADDVKYTVSHVVEPVERGIARINETIHIISKNVKKIEKRKKKSKDDSYLIPLQSTSSEFHHPIPEGSFSDSGLNRFKPSRSKKSTIAREFEIGGDRWS